jgi:hypothetical protein
MGYSDIYVALSDQGNWYIYHNKHLSYLCGGNIQKLIKFHFQITHFFYFYGLNVSSQKTGVKSTTRNATVMGGGA